MKIQAGTRGQSDELIPCSNKINYPKNCRCSILWHNQLQVRRAYKIRPNSKMLFLVTLASANKIEETSACDQFNGVLYLKVETRLSQVLLNWG